MNGYRWRLAAALAALLLFPLTIPAQEFSTRDLPKLVMQLKTANQRQCQQASDAIYRIMRYRIFGDRVAALEPLYAMLDDPDSQHRATAAALLGKLNDPHAVDRLLRLLQAGDTTSRLAAANALLAIGDPQALTELGKLRTDPEPQLRGAALNALRRAGGPESLDAIAGLLDDPGLGLRLQAAAALAQAGDPRGRQALLAVAADAGQAQATRLDAIMTLANRRDPAAAEPLIAFLNDATPMQRQAVIMALGKLGDPRAVEPLVPYMQSDDRRVRTEAITAVMALGDPRGLAAARHLYEANVIDRRQYLNLLAGVRDPAAVDLLVSCFPHIQPDESPTDMQLTALIHTLADMGTPAVERLALLLREDADPELRRTAAYLCSEVRDARLAPALIPLLKDEDDEIRMLAADALCRLADARAIAPLAAAIKEGSPRVRLNIVRQLGDFRDPQIIPIAAEALQDPNDGIRRAAVWALWWLRDPAIIPVLLPMLDDPSWLVRYAAVDALRESGGQLWVADLQGRLYDPRADVRRNAAMALRADGTLEAFDALLEAVAENPDLVAALNINVYAPITAPEIINRLLAAAQGDDPQACALALNALSGVADVRVTAVALARVADPHDAVRAGAMRALAGAAGKLATAALIAGLHDPVQAVQASAIQALGKCPDTAAAVPALVPLLESKDQRIPYLTVQALGAIKGLQAMDALIDALDRNTQTFAVIQVLKSSDDPRAMPILFAIANTDGSYQNQAFAALVEKLDPRLHDLAVHFDPAELLNRRPGVRGGTSRLTLSAKMGDTRVIPPAMELLHDNDAGLRADAAEALGLLKATVAVDDLIAMLDNFDWPGQGAEGYPGCFTHGNVRSTTRDKVAAALGAIGDLKAVEPLIASLGRGAMTSRGASATALGTIGDQRAVTPLITELPNLTGDARKAAVASLQKLTGQDFGTDIAHWQQWLAAQ